MPSAQRIQASILGNRAQMNAVLGRLAAGSLRSRAVLANQGTATTLGDALAAQRVSWA